MGLGSDSALDSVVHEGLHAALGKFFPSLVEIQAATVTQRPNGERVESWATAWVRYGNFAQLTATEVRDGVMTRVPAGYALNLAGYYPEITNAHRVVVDYETFNIAAVVHDSVAGSTRLSLERVEH